MKWIDKGLNPIGHCCDYCDEIITPDDDEGGQYWLREDDEGNRRYVDGVFYCCIECLYELQDGDIAAEADAVELGLDYVD